MKLLSLWNNLQEYLFPTVQYLLDEELTEKQKTFVKVCELAQLDDFMTPYLWNRIGRPPKDRLNLLKCFVAKAVYNEPQTRAFIDLLKSSDSLRRLCGWERRADIPHESKFSRVFDLFSTTQLPQKIHEAMVKSHLENKIIGHISRDSTAIDAREKVQIEPKSEEVVKKKHGRGRPKKGEKREAKPPKRVTLQLNRSLEENLEYLPTLCNKGTKKNSNGYKISWKGYKLHLDCVDGDIPISAILTSASLHDSQAAIPLAQQSARLVTNLYDLMDAAYDSPEIHQFSKELGHIPLIDNNKRKGKKKEFTDLEKRRYNNRSTAERVNSNLKDNYAGREIRVKGHAKVMAHLMFSLIALTANQLFKMLE